MSFRWQFGLRSLLVVTAIAAMAFAVIHYWINGAGVEKLFVANVLMWLAVFLWFAVTSRRDSN
jgi:hypothetical protein